MKNSPTRKEIQRALEPALIKAIDDLDVVQNSTTLLRTIRALTEIAYDLAISGDCTPTAMLETLHYVTRKRLPQLKSGRPIWVQREAKA